MDKLSAQVDDAAIDRTLDILRKQRRTFAQRAQDQAAADGDRVTIDFAGKIDGEAFEGGKAEGFQFIVGDGQMLKEFEDAVRGMKSGESKTFPLAFPEDYHGKDVAGKTADFLVTVNKIEAAHLPDVDEALAKSLGIAEGTVEGLRADIKKNLEREVKHRLQARNKQAAMDALAAKAELDLPKSVVQAELDRLQSMLDSISQELESYLEEHSIEDGLLAPARAALGKDVPLPALPQLEGVAWPMVTERPPHLLPAGYDSWDALLEDAAAETRDTLLRVGPIERRSWGEQNTANICHPLAGALPAFAKPWLCMPFEPLPGDTAVPRVQTPDKGASQRMVVAPGREAEGIAHMPGGQSGHPLSPFWGAGHDDWVHGRATPFLPGATKHTLRMAPTQENGRR